MLNTDKDYIVTDTAELSDSLKNKTINGLIRTPIVLNIVILSVHILLGLYFYFAISNFTEKIYVTGYGGTYIAESSNGKIKPFEVENFIKVFLRTMYGHDANTFKNRVETALKYVAKDDAKKIIDDFNRSRLHEQYVKTGGSTRLEVDSLYIKTESVPYECLIYSRQLVYNNSREIEQPMGFRLFVKPIERTDNNPFGLLIQDLSFFDYKLKEQEPRFKKIDSVPLDTTSQKDTLQQKK